MGQVFEIGCSFLNRDTALTYCVRSKCTCNLIHCRIVLYIYQPTQWAHVNPNILGQRIKQARESMGMSQGEFARAVGKDQSDISQYETGKRKIAAVDLLTFAKVLNVPIVYFYEGQFEIDALDQILLDKFHALPTQKARQTALAVLQNLLDLLDTSAEE